MVSMYKRLTKQNTGNGNNVLSVYWLIIKPNTDMNQINEVAKLHFLEVINFMKYGKIC